MIVGEGDAARAFALTRLAEATGTRVMRLVRVAFEEVDDATTTSGHIRWRWHQWRHDCGGWLCERARDDGGDFGRRLEPAAEGCRPKGTRCQDVTSCVVTVAQTVGRQG